MECHCLNLLGLIRSALATMPEPSADYPFVKLASDAVRDLMQEEYSRIAARHEYHTNPPKPRPLGRVG